MRAGYYKRTGGIFLALLLVLSFAYSAMGGPLRSAQGKLVKEEDRKAIGEKALLAQMPFIENVGQVGDESTGQATVDRRVKYYVKTFGGTAFIREDGVIVYSLSGVDGKGWAIEERFVGASVAAVTGEMPAEARVSYFKGNDPSRWRSDIGAYGVVSLGELYPGIELKLKAHGDNIEKLFRVKPGAEPGSIRVRLEGAERLSANGEGELEVETGLGLVKFTKPVAYQEEQGRRNYIQVAYAVKGDGYTFKVGEYDRSKELVIDPLLSSTFIGGTSYDSGYSIALDGSGKVYVAGSIGSSDFPTTAGAYDTAFNGYRDVFVARLDGNLSSLLSSTFIGGSSYDSGSSIALDGAGNVYVAGYTESSDFPTTAGAYDTAYNGSGDYFVARLDAALSSLLSSTFIGGTGSEYEYANFIALDGAGDVYITGYTYSSDFPTTAGAYDTAYNGNYDVFVARLDADLRSLLSSTFLGGWGTDLGYSIALDGAGNVYVAGYTSFSSGFPTTAGAYDTTHNGSSDVFVARLSGDLASLLSSTFIGGSSGDYAHSIALDGAGNVYVAGYTESSDFPTTAGAYDTTHNGNSNVFVARLNGKLSSLLSSTFLGGSSYDYALSIALDASGNVYVAGYTYSSDFPTTAGAYDTTYNGGDYDVFVARLSGDLSSLLSSTFLGGSSSDSANSIAVDGSGNVYVAGSTGLSDFPTTAGAYDTTHNGSGDVFVARLDADLSASPPSQADMWVFPGRHYFGSVEVNDTSDSQAFMLSNIALRDVLIGTLWVTGADASQFIIWVDDCSGELLSLEDICEVSLVFSPASAGPKSAFLVISSGDPENPALSIALSGVGTLDGDIDGDGSVTILDVIRLMRKVVGLQ